MKKILFEENNNNGVLLGEMAGVLSSCKVTEPWFSTIYLHTSKGNYSDMTVLMNEDFVFEESSLYQAFLSEKGPIIWGDFYRDPVFISRRPVVPVIYKLEVAGSQEPVGILVNLDQANIAEYMKWVENPSGAFAAISGRNGEKVVKRIITRLKEEKEKDEGGGGFWEEKRKISSCSRYLTMA